MAVSADQVAFTPIPPDSPDADRVSFGMVVGENGFRLAAYDVFGTSGAGVAGVSSRRADTLTHDESLFVLLNGDTLDEVTDLWKKLSQGGTVIQSLAPTPWDAPYGMLTDRFGVTWIVGTSPV